VAELDGDGAVEPEAFARKCRATIFGFFRDYLREDFRIGVPKSLVVLYNQGWFG